METDRLDGTSTPGRCNGGGWTDAPYTDATRAALVERIGEQQRRIAASRASGLNGHADRGQHQKRLLAARGRLRIFDALPDPLKTGPFASPLSFAAACRFSSGQPCTFPDASPDVRGVALKFFLPGNDEVDLLMTNEGGRSHAADARSFMAFADVLVAKIEAGPTGALRELAKALRRGELTVGEVAQIGYILVKEVGLHGARSLTAERYWGSVVALGPAALKYSLHPSPSVAPSGPLRTHGTDRLREDLLRRLAQGPVRWQLAVQLFVDEASTPVNDAAQAWSSPLITVGELEIASAPTAGDEDTIDRMAFNPAHGFEPLGITHARKDVYAASASNRRDRGLLSADEARRYLASEGACAPR